MPARRQLVTIAAFILMGTLVCFWFLRPDEPRHMGKPLSVWLRIYYESDRPNRDPGERAAASAAVRAIGTNGLPFMVESLRYEGSMANSVLAFLPSRVAMSRPARATLYRGFHRAEAARAGLRLLGTNATAALPELRKLMRDPSHPATAARAILLLGGLGAPGFETLEAGLADTNQPYREIVATTMAIWSTRHVGTNACLAAIRPMLNDANPLLRTRAKQLVEMLEPGTGPLSTNAAPVSAR